MSRIITSAALLAVAMSFGLFKSGPADAETDEGSMEISRNETRPAGPGPAKTFTGDVSVKPLFGANDVRTISAGQVTFSPCARSAWHTHPAGQTLIVTAGTGWVQQWGGEKQQMNTGDVIWTPPGVKHWHGATDSGGVTHIALQDSVDGRNVDWMEHVTDDQYNS
jgi:quercetin dioxygenase-like cupin family protein